MQIDIGKFVQERVTPFRYKHSQRVADLAVKLAKKHGLDAKEAYLAGILHDLCREIPPERLLALAKEHNIIVAEYEKNWPIVLHGKVAAEVYQDQFNLSDAVKDAIAFHVTGRPGMRELAYIIYLADKLEEGRDYPGIEKLRLLAMENYPAALLESLNSSLYYLLQKGCPIHPDTIALRNSLLLKFKP
mgnify:FL=1